MNDLYIDGQWYEAGGPAFESLNPATGEACWRGHAADADDVHRALTAARRAAPDWSALDQDTRVAHLNRFTEQLQAARESFARTIMAETGKPLWEARTEVDAMLAKVPASIDAHKQRRSTTRITLNDAEGVTRYKAHGVVAVFGPFNLPGHLPNAHIVPALLAGNTIVYKPSEQAPSVAAHVMRLWADAGLPAGALNVVQGARDTGALILEHRELDGLFFTGSHAAGRAINRALADRPGTIVALEMGGNNPLVVWDVNDLDAAAYHTILSAFITAGQRCTCARRLIVPNDHRGERFLHRLIAMVAALRVGPPDDDPPPFVGTLISPAAADSVLQAYETLTQRGAQPLHPMTRAEYAAAMLTPGIVDVTHLTQRDDEEVFGPLLQVIRVSDFDAALTEANATRYGLSAALLSDDARLFDRFVHHIRAGIVNWNRQTTGASGRLPFGGAGESGNHRPSGYFAADYCAYPVASVQRAQLTMPDAPLPGIMR